MSTDQTFWVDPAEKVEIVLLGEKILLLHRICHMLQKEIF